MCIRDRYKVQDPRSPVVKNWVEKLVDNDFSKNRFEIAKKIDQIMDEEKNLFPNVDFYGGLLLAELGFEVDLFTCLLYTSPSPRDRSLSRMPSSA